MKMITQVCWWGAKKLGLEILDVHTGKRLGTGFVVAFGKRVYVIGYRGEPLVPVFRSQKNIKYSRLEIGFTTHEYPDYERIK